MTPHIIEPGTGSNAASAKVGWPKSAGHVRRYRLGYTAAAMAHDSPGESDVYFEITVIGGSAKVSAVDGATAIEVAVIGPATASLSDLKKLALGKLKARIARERQGGGIS